jgi:hypothetical protein
VCIHKGKRSAQLLTKARILLKADVSEAGKGWSDSRIAEALDTSIANILRTRRQLVEEGFEAVLTRKYNPNSARPEDLINRGVEGQVNARCLGSIVQAKKVRICIDSLVPVVADASAMRASSCAARWHEPRWSQPPS